MVECSICIAAEQPNAIFHRLINTYGSLRQRKFYSGGISGKYSFCLPFVALTCHRKPPLEQNGAFQCGKYNTGFYRHEILETHSQLRSLHTLTLSELNAKDISLRLSISSISFSDTSTRTPLHPMQTNPQTYQALSSTDWQWIFTQSCIWEVLKHTSEGAYIDKQTVWS